MEPPPYKLSVSHSFAREDEFFSAVEKFNSLEGDRNEMGFTPTRPFHSDGKSKPFKVGHLYSTVGKSKPLREDRNEMAFTPYSTFPLR